MRAVVWQQAGVPQATIDGLAKEVATGLPRCARMPPAWQRRVTRTLPTLPQLKSIAAKSDVYAQQLGDALDLMEDPAIAIGYFRRADATFEALRDEISGLAAAHRAVETNCHTGRARQLPSSAGPHLLAVRRFPAGDADPDAGRGDWRSPGRSAR